MEKYKYIYDKEKGYIFSPNLKNNDLLKILPKRTELTGLIKVCKKNDKIYLFFVVDELQKADREADKPMIIYKLDFDELSLIKELKEVIEKLEKNYLTENEKENILFILKNLRDNKDNKKFSFLKDMDVIPFFIMKNFNEKNICFEKIDNLNIKLDKIQKCILKNFDDVFNYYEYLKTKDLRKIFKCIDDEKTLISLLEDCRKEIYLTAKKYNLNMQNFILEKDCLELKRELLKYVVEKEDTKEINKLYKALKSKIFLGI